MRKYLLIVVCIVVLAFSGCSSSNEKDGKPSEIPYSRIQFEILDENSGYVGTYWIKRSNQFTSWDEWGEWTELQYFVDRYTGGAKVCFGYFPPENKANFAAKEDYSWEECRSEGRDCLCLRKK
ncbi:MAG TPA: hypothetical protein PLW74_01175 [Candidatus Dojkabacteria bacterium]|jgi:hypothetical protein|nr:hypothetical protein [Candidatus Dojkabacteria bacterium]